MKKLILKKEYEGLKITRNCIGLGQVIFDAYTVKEEHYENYQRLGFNLFDEVKPVRKTKK